MKPIEPFVDIIRICTYKTDGSEHLECDTYHPKEVLDVASMMNLLVSDLLDYADLDKLVEVTRGDIINAFEEPEKGVGDADD